MTALTKARDLLSDPNRWCKGSLARTQTKNYTEMRDPKAYQFCLIGCLTKVRGLTKGRPFLQRAINKKMGYTYDIMSFNDGHYTTHEDILEVLDLAICMECSSLESSEELSKAVK